MWLLEIELRTSGRAIRVLNHRVISPAQSGCFYSSYSELFIGDDDVQPAGDNFRGHRRHGNMAPWHCGGGGDRVLLQHISRMWFWDMEKNTFSGPALHLMTFSPGTNCQKPVETSFPGDSDLYGKLRASAMD
ncbi:mCG1050899 [Mus musculus]|nr:mCG1050899 [Mus musculus]